MAPRSGRRLVERHFVDNGYDYAHLQIKICFRKTEMFSFIVENNLNHGKDDYQVGHHQSPCKGTWSRTKCLKVGRSSLLSI